MQTEVHSPGKGRVENDYRSDDYRSDCQITAQQFSGSVLIFKSTFSERGKRKDTLYSALD